VLGTGRHHRTVRNKKRKETFQKNFWINKFEKFVTTYQAAWHHKIPRPTTPTTLKIEAASSSEMLIFINQVTRHHIS
jgi:hypothetical protein